MRHRKKINHLGRTASHRKAMLSNMASSLILSEKKRIITTLAKAKALRTYVEPLITKSKTDTTHSRRTVFSHLGNKDAVKELFLEVAVKVADRPGGYTRVLKLGPRKSDNAEMALIELVDFSEFGTEKPKRRRRKKKKSSGEAEAKPKAKKEQKEKAAEDTAAKEKAAAEEVETKAEATEVAAEETEAEETKAKAETPVAEEGTETPEAKAEEPTTEEKSSEEEE